MIKGVILDADGVLIDSLSYWDALVPNYLKRHKLVFERKDLIPLQTASFEEGVAFLKKFFKIEASVSNILKELEMDMKEAYEHQVPLMKGAKEMLAYWKSKGIRLVVASSGIKSLLEKALSRLEALEYLEGIVTCDEVGVGKTSSDVYDKACSIMNLSKEEVIVVEDDIHALQVLRNANYKTIGIGARYIYQPLSEYTAMDFEEIYRGWEDIIVSGNTTLPVVMSIAGSDCSGGAGIQADMKTMSALDVFGTTAITAITAQNTCGVVDVQSVSPQMLQQQINCILEDFEVKAIKVGMLFDTPLIKEVVEALNRSKAKAIIVDPVMISTSGSKLLKDEAIAYMKEELFSKATLLTPNILEAGVLLDMTISNAKEQEEAAIVLSKAYNTAVLVKGGHGVHDANDVLCNKGVVTWYRGERIDNKNTHGTGCTLSSAIAASMANDYTLEQAIQVAKDYLTKAIAANLNLGKCSGPLQHKV